MGTFCRAICKECGTKFKFNDGGGFHFHVLRCDKCGGERHISFEEIGEPHKRFIRGLSVPYCGVTADQDREIQKNYPGEPLSEREYRQEVEKIAGHCECRGQFKFDAPVRCPKCRSQDFDPDPEFPPVCFD